MSKKKGIALFLVLTTILTVIVLSGVVMAIILSQSRLTQHQLSRTKAHYAAQAGLNYTLEMLRLGTWVPNPAGPSAVNKHACLNGCVDTGVIADYTIPNDPDIPYHVQVTIYPLGTGGISGTTRLDAKTSYTYTP